MERTMKILLALCCAVSALAVAAQSLAHSASQEECKEGSEFIRNAALSRDNGMDGRAFIAQALADFEAIKAFPAELRWFVQDQDDERFLLAAVKEVFERPQAPTTHERVFLDECMRRSAI
jgi:hypothetical protein